MNSRWVLLLSLVSLLLVSAPLVAANDTALDLAKIKSAYKRPTSIPYPKDNPYSAAKYQLGKILFFDPRLSASGVTSCATCHNPSFDWGDGMAKGVGFQHAPLARKSPTLLNLAWDELYFWDGRADSLEAQALGPIASAAEMNMQHDVMIKTIKNISGYTKYFHDAFPGESDPITKENVAKSIATFERQIVSAPAPFDLWISGNEKAISAEAKKGFVVFNNQGKCSSCHSGWSFSDDSFHDIGIKDDDIGRGKYVKSSTMQHAFKTVGLRNIEKRFPYMHDGSLNTLEAVIDHYNGGFEDRDSLDESMKSIHLSEEDKVNLISFLSTLTSNDKPVSLPVMPR